MTQRRPMTSDEQIAVNALKGVTFPVASWDKRFARSLESLTTITEKEAPQVWRLFWRYRRQIDCPDKQRLLPIASKLAAPDFRKIAAAQSAQARIDAMRQQAQ